MPRPLSETTYPASSFWTDPCSAGESLPRRGMRFLAVLGAHVAVIAGSVELASRPEVRQAVEQIYVRLVEAPQPKALPVAQEPKPAPVERKPVVRKPEPPPPILAAAAEAPSTASFAVPPQPPAPPLPAPIQAAPTPQPVVTAARFDADYLLNPKPAYPTVSRRRAEEGTVLLRVRVSAEGAALAVELRKSSGYPRLDEAAQEAVRRWRFVPARQGSEAIESWVAVPIAFKLES
jgi:protein TonB